MSRLDVAAAIEAVRQAKSARLEGPPKQRESWPKVVTTLETVRRNVRRDMHPPVEEVTARSLDEYVNAVLDFLEDELTDLIDHANAAGSRDENVITLGEKALERLAAQAEFSHHYFDEVVQRARKERPMDQFEAELRAMEARCTETKVSLVSFLDRSVDLLKAATGG
jgi:hypothetical protein